MHEILTLQLGQASNYLATHFWNTQESYFAYGDKDDKPVVVNPDVHWRSGIGADGGETFLPRTVIYDLKGGFGSLRKINALYDPGDDPAASLLWQTLLDLFISVSLPYPTTAHPNRKFRDRSPIVHKLPGIRPSDYQQSLDAGEAPSRPTPDQVRYWSDFSRVFFHPKSLNQLYDYELDSTIRPFDRWHLGQDLFQTIDREQDMVDRDFRPFAEEADQMQAIQVFTSLDDAWGGFAADYLERLRDEFPKATLWVWGLQSSRLPRAQLANTARSLAAICEQTSMLVPLTVPLGGLGPNVRLTSDSAWQTSALLSTALETAGLSSRTKTRGSTYSASLADIVDRLNPLGRQPIGRLQMSLKPAAPLDEVQGNPPCHTGDAEQASLDMDFFHLLGQQARPIRGPFATPTVFGRSRTSRGMGPRNVEDQDDEGNGGPFGQGSRGRVINSYYENIAFPLLDSFPQIYTDELQQPLTVPASVTTSLTVDSSVSTATSELRTLVASSIRLEDREDLGNDLAELAEAYRDGWESGSDDGDDGDG